MPSPTDPTNPSHYNQFSIEPIDFIMSNSLPFWAGNVVKYVCRADNKGGVEDLRKAIRYIEFRINELEGRKATEDGPVVTPITSFDDVPF